MSNRYQPPYTITPAIVGLVVQIGEALGRLSALADTVKTARLRRINRVRTIRGSLAIEGNTLNEAQISAILDGKRVIAPPREILEARNAIAAYDRFEQWQTLILTCWNPHFAHIPVESLVHEMSLPDKPNSRLQRYCLTDLGRAARD